MAPRYELSIEIRSAIAALRKAGHNLLYNAHLQKVSVGRVQCTLKRHVYTKSVLNGSRPRQTSKQKDKFSRVKCKRNK